MSNNYTVNLKNENIYLRKNGNVLQTMRVSGATDANIQDDEVEVYTDDNLYLYEIRSGRLVLVKTQRL